MNSIKSPTFACVTSGRNLWSPFPTVTVCVCAAAVVVGLGLVPVELDAAINIDGGEEKEDESAPRQRATT